MKEERKKPEAKDPKNGPAEPAQTEPQASLLSGLSFPVSPAKASALKRRMATLGIREEDLVENFIRGSGKGGQKINKTSSCVQLMHKPSSIQVRCQKGRSQAENRYHARTLLCDAVEQKITGEVQRKKEEREKIRRQKRRRTRRGRERMLEEKRAVAEKKVNRRKVGLE